MGNGGTVAGDNKTGETLSQFLARILNQLSLTSWLPALALVAATLVLAQVSRKGGSMTEAFSAIGDLGFAAIVLLAGGVVVAAVFTQAFEFAVIRIVEGYWRPSGPLDTFGRWRTKRHRAKVEALRQYHKDALLAAIQSTRIKLRKEGYGTGVYDALESSVANIPMPEGVTAEDRSKALKLVLIWRRFADPVPVQKADGLERWINEYPELGHRVLPTRLGNIIRAAEDKVHDPTQGRMETFILGIADDLPQPIRRTYLENRRRLDLYCGLVVVFGAAILPSAILGQFYDDDQRATAIAVPLVMACLTFVSYRAALASGRTFRLALLAIKEHLDRQRATPKTGHPAPAALPMAP